MRINDLLIADILAFLLLVIVFFFPGNPLRPVIALPLMLFVPGYLLTEIIFPDGRDPVERYTMGVGLSIALVILLVFLLNFTFGIRETPLTLSFVGLIFFLSLVIVYRRSR